MKKPLAIAALLIATLLVLTSIAQAKEIPSSKVKVDASRLIERTVLLKDASRSLLIQVQQEFLHGATDVSNTSRLVFSVAVLDEMSETTASFVLTEAMGLVSAKRVSGGVYEVTYLDARALNTGGKLEVTKRIDARQAVQQVLRPSCPEFEACELKTTVSFN